MRLRQTWGILVSCDTESLSPVNALLTHLPADAMNEVAWCYLEGYGCKKDKVRTLDIHSPRTSHGTAIDMNCQWLMRAVKPVKNISLPPNT